jgi:hypothetical protein
LVATKLVPVETSSKVTVGPLASGDLQVTLSDMECLPQVLALDLAGPLVALCVSLYKSCSLRLPQGGHNAPHKALLRSIAQASHKLRQRSRHQAI